MHKCLRQLKMRFREIAVDLQCVAKLNGRFAPFSLGAIVFAALQVFVLGDLWISVTSGEDSKGNQESSECKKSAPKQMARKPAAVPIKYVGRAVHDLPSFLAVAGVRRPRACSFKSHLAFISRRGIIRE